MKDSIRLFVRFLVPALMLAFSTTTPAMKHEMDKAKDAKAAPAAKDAKAAPAKKGEPTQKVFLDNDKVRVMEVTFKPGDAGASIERPLRVIRVVKGGTLTLIYPDGKKEKLVWKTGDTQVRQPSPVYSPKNEGKSDIVLYVVNVKEAKK